ncbi:programmed cell death protein 2 [Stachybotrys elegans]|uniref:Programmed cell death protein 2 n=1 Tax=Stachybotrys elegans TaxID=80388 RepID=A0A8K0SUH2_9HYPO|nr:programmed cell death protein 2 [Stachybotrys elegans]
MAAYDSDSSAGEFEETNVLLGYASKDADEDTISRIGGRPEWLDPENPPTAAFARCKVCKGMMVLLLQLNGELPERFPGHDRRLYVFACRRSTCRRKEGSIRALRSVRVWKEVQNEPPKVEAKEAEKKEQRKPDAAGPGLGEALFGAKPLGGASANPFSSNANPFSSSSSNNPFGSPPANPFSPKPEKPAESSQPAEPTETETAVKSLPKTFAETLSLNVPPAQPPPPAEPWPEAASQPKPYPTLYLADAEYETLDPVSTKVPENARVEAADADEPSALDREAFESSMDATFQKFADRLSQNPDQVIRYEFAGTPLLYSKTDSVGEKLTKSTMPGCPNCGGRRTFEVQLTPHAITELEADDLSLEGMEWGTIIVGVCEKDCTPRHTEIGQVGYLEEWSGVQWEELSKMK